MALEEPTCASVTFLFLPNQNSLEFTNNLPTHAHARMACSGVCGPPIIDGTHSTLSTASGLAFALVGHLGQGLHVAAVKLQGWRG